MKSIAVFAGSNNGNNPAYRTMAAELGRQLAEEGIRMVYGGSLKGLMGSAADACLQAGGEVAGVMPVDLFQSEIRHNGLTTFIEVADMHERKAVMSGMADGFIALPGGIGTFEELFEVMCWAMIGLHRKPIGLLNVDGYYDPLLDMLEHTIRQGFAAESCSALWCSAHEPALLLQRLKEAAMQNASVNTAATAAAES